MATGPGFPAPNNTFIATHEGSGRLTVGFSRNADKFKLPRYSQIVKAPNTVGYYLKLTAQDAARVVTVQDYIWPDGQKLANDSGTESFNFVQFRTERFAYPFRLGQKAAEQATWPIIEQHSQIKAAKCMTARTIRMLTAATTAANWTSSADPDVSADHTGTATAAAGSGGGKFDVGTGAQPNLKIGLGYAADLINQDTLGVVDGDPEQFFLVMNPNDARLIAKSAEVHNYIANSMAAKMELESGGGPNAKYGLPSQLYGYQIIVENAPKITSRKGATLAKSYVLPNGSILLLSKPAAMEGVYGSPSFSTLTLFAYEEMSLQAQQDSWNRLVEGRVVEDTAEAVTCPASGYYFTACTG